MRISNSSLKKIKLNNYHFFSDDLLANSLEKLISATVFLVARFNHLPNIIASVPRLIHELKP